MLKHFDHVTVAGPAAAIGFGFNHVCFVVSDVDELISTVTTAGVRRRDQPMTFHGRKLVFLEGREGIAVELARRN
jgi:hypothetical protein